MAYMNQAKKAKIAEALKKVMPRGWKYTLRVRDHSTIVCTIRQAPVDLMAAVARNEYNRDDTYFTVNTYHVRSYFEDECVADVMERIVAALNTGNWDRSDIQTDYFDVGHYVDLRIGSWDKPFVYKPEPLPISA